VSGHGWVVPNENGLKARCGGPAICSQCAKELAQHSVSLEPVKEALNKFNSLRPCETVDSMWELYAAISKLTEYIEFRDKPVELSWDEIRESMKSQRVQVISDGPEVTEGEISSILSELVGTEGLSNLQYIARQLLQRYEIRPRISGERGVNFHD
jgi:hypothetical protein